MRRCFAFGVIGLLLTRFGVLGDEDIYYRSLDINEGFRGAAQNGVADVIFETGAVKDHVNAN